MTVTDQNNLTFRTLVERIMADDSLPPAKRRAIASGLRSFVKAMHLPIDTAVPSAPALREMIAKVTPLMLGLKPGTWKNVRTHLQAALARAGRAAVPRRYNEAPSPGWAELLEPLVYGERYRLSHIARYCTSIGVEPEQLDDAVMGRLLKDLRERSLKAEPDRVHRDAAVMWNRLAAANLAWPQQRLTVADNRSTYSISWDTFPASLREDIDAWLAHLAGADPFKPRTFRALRPASLKTREKQLRLYLASLVLGGVNPASLTSLKAAVLPERAKVGFMFFWARAGNQASRHGSQIAGMVLSIARHWVKLPKKSIDVIKASAFQLQVEPQSGMTAKNEDRVRPLTDPERREDYAGLTEKLVERVYRAGPATRTLAVQMRVVVAIEILTMMPMRVGNLQNLRLDQNFHYGRRPNDVTISIPSHKVKNGQSVEYIVPEPSAELLTRYIKDYRPLLDNPDSPWLFPGQQPGQPLCYETLRQQITKVMRDNGYDFRPHTFRHIAGLIILTDNPGAYGQVQRVLGHKNIQTTMNSYTGMERVASVAHFDKTMLAMRQRASAYKKDRPPSKPKIIPPQKRGGPDDVTSL